MQVADLIQQAYDAAGSSERWAEFLRRYVECFHADGAMLIHHPRETNTIGVKVAFGFDEQRLVAFDQHFAPRNPYHAPCTKLPVGKLVHAHQVVQRDAGLRSEFYADFVRPQRLSLMALMTKTFESSCAVSGFSTHYAAGVADDAVMESMPRHQLVTCHLPSAIRLHHRLAELEEENAELLAALESTHFAVAVCDSAGKANVLTRSARQLVADQDGLRWEGGYLHAERTLGGVSLSRIVREVAALSERESDRSPRTVRVQRPSGRQDYELVILPVPERQQWARRQGGRVLVFIHDPERTPPPSAALYGLLFGLTRKESRVLDLLTRGHSTKEVGDELMIGRETVRTHLKALFSKLGVRGQTELLAKAMSGLGRLRVK
jgi:DNA-binding CsgD family transcriptional regulator